MRKELAQRAAPNKKPRAGPKGRPKWRKIPKYPLGNLTFGKQILRWIAEHLDFMINLNIFYATLLNINYNLRNPYPRKQNSY